MSGMTKSKILEFSRGYPVYLFALTLAGITACLTFYLLAIFPPIGFWVFIVFREQIPTEAIAPIIMVPSIPAAVVFHLFLRKTALRLPISATIFSYFAGSGTAILLMPLIATPYLSQLDGFLIFIGLACTAGYLFVYWQRIPKRSKADT